MESPDKYFFVTVSAFYIIRTKLGKIVNTCYIQESTFNQSPLPFIFFIVFGNLCFFFFFLNNESGIFRDPLGLLNP
jgi:hypothetical protein